MDTNDTASSRITKLTRSNYETWFSHIDDYIGALDHEDAYDMITAFRWTPSEDQPDDPADHDYQAAGNAAAKKLRLVHNKAWKFIRSSLTDDIHQTTLHLGHKSVPKLLRHLRDYWHDGSVFDRKILRDEYQDSKLEDFENLETFTTAFQNRVVVMRQHKMGLVNDDEDILAVYEEALPAAWHQAKMTRLAQELTYTRALKFYANMAKSDTSLPGAVNYKPTSGTDTSHNTADRDLP
jgi:hypothetical protein